MLSFGRGLASCSWFLCSDDFLCVFNSFPFRKLRRKSQIVFKISWRAEVRVLVTCQPRKLCSVPLAAKLGSCASQKQTQNCANATLVIFFCFIELQNGLGGTFKSTLVQPLAMSRNSRSSHPKPHPTWPGMFPGKGHPLPLWVTCCRASPPSLWKNFFQNKTQSTWIPCQIWQIEL